MDQPQPLDRFTLRQLSYFVTVAEEGTLAAAAERHHISQSAISLSMSQLERGLSVQLIMRRRSRGVALTDAARRVLPEVRRLLAHASEVESVARSLGTSVGGDLVVGCFPTLTPFVIPPILRGFAEVHPGVSVHLTEGSVRQLSAGLTSGECEIALMYDLGIPPEVSKTHLYRIRPYVLLAADHALAASGPVRLSTLADEPMIMLDMPPSREMFERVLAAGGVTPNIRFVSTHFESVRSLVASGVGYSLLLQRPSSEFTYAGPGLVHREILDEVETVDVVLATARDARVTRRAAAFAAFVTDHGADLARGWSDSSS